VLADLESRLVTALAGVHPGSVKLVAGPWPGPAPAETEALSLHAAELTLPEREGEDVLAGRGPAHLETLHTFSADGDRTLFTLPESASAEIHEVESPAGRPARAGEAYVVEGRSLRFYEPPAAGTVVVVGLRGPRARGFDERRAARVDLVATAWAAGVTRADEILERSLGAIFPAFLELGTLGARRLGDSDAALRLRAPQAYLHGLERATRALGARSFVTALARIRVVGELQVAVMAGAAAPARRIDELRYSGKVLAPGK